MTSKLSDNEAHERLVKAREALGDDQAQTVHANTALDAGRTALSLLQFGLVAASDKATEPSDEPAPPPSRR